MAKAKAKQTDSESKRRAAVLEALRLELAQGKREGNVSLEWTDGGIRLHFLDGDRIFMSVDVATDEVLKISGDKLLIDWGIEL